MASELSSASISEDCCVVCANKYQRNRASLYQCKHCSQALCLDCMKDHKEEILQVTSNLSDRYNQLLQSLSQKQMMVEDETTRSLMAINDWYNNYMKDLTNAKEKLLREILSSKEQKEVRWNILED